MNTALQDNLLSFISEHSTAYGKFPTYLEIITTLGITPKLKSLIIQNIRILNKEGKIQLKKDGLSNIISLPQKHFLFSRNISSGVSVRQ